MPSSVSMVCSATIASMIWFRTWPCRSTMEFCQGDSVGTTSDGMAILSSVDRQSAPKNSPPWSVMIRPGGPAQETHERRKARVTTALAVSIGPTSNE